MAAPEDLIEEYTGTIVPYSFHAGFVALSYTVSLIGTSTTLELIRRRTSPKGTHNLLLLIGSAVSMGGIAIWSMHFIGNRAIYMLNGQEELQIAYSTGLTVVSLLVPILVLLLAFLCASFNGRIRWWRILLAGVLSGTAICGMHYLGNASISNYRSSYEVAYVVGAALIAVSASTTALAVFFVFEAAWENAWWKRLGCAGLLAAGVSGMHWCAAVGTSYRLQGSYTPGQGVSRLDSMIVVICLSISAGILMVACAMYSSWVRRDYLSKSQQFVLAAAVFDPKGRILVNQQGFLPSELVMDTLLPKTNDDIFSTAHPLFHWMFTASRNWEIITRVIGQMAKHINTLSQDKGGNGRATVKLLSEDGVLLHNYDTIIRELFCLAADALSTKMKETLPTAGELWDEIFVTGKSLTNGHSNSPPPSPTDNDIEKGTRSSGDTDPKRLSSNRTQLYGRGCLMFLVKQVDNKRDVEKFEASGYRFAEIHQVANNIQSSMQIKTEDLESRFRAMSVHSEKTSAAGALEAGVHLAMFAVRARLDRSGFDVLVPHASRSVLPTVSLPYKTLKPCHLELLSSCRGMGLLKLATNLEALAHEPLSRELHEFATEMSIAIWALREALDDTTFDAAELLPREVEVPSALPDSSQAQSSSVCTFVTFQLLLPIHSTAPRSTSLEFVPLNFFKLRQLLYDGSPLQLNFAHSVHRDMSYNAESEQNAQREHVLSRGQFSRMGSKVKGIFPTTRITNPAKSRLGGDESDTERFARAPSTSGSGFRSTSGTITSDCPEHSPASPTLLSSPGQVVRAGSQKKSSHKLFGGILVSSDIRVKVQETTHTSDISSETNDEVELVGMRSRSGSSAAPIDTPYTAVATGLPDHESAADLLLTGYDEMFSMTMEINRPRR